MRCQPRRRPDPTRLDPTEEEVDEMAATIVIEQDPATWTGHLHRYNGYSSGFSTPGSEVLRTSRKIGGSGVAANPHYRWTAGRSRGAAA
jgi:hypothetical protein